MGEVCVCACGCGGLGQVHCCPCSPGLLCPRTCKDCHQMAPPLFLLQHVRRFSKGQWGVQGGRRGAGHTPVSGLEGSASSGCWKAAARQARGAREARELAPPRLHPALAPLRPAHQDSGPGLVLFRSQVTRLFICPWASPCCPCPWSGSTGQRLFLTPQHSRAGRVPAPVPSLLTLPGSGGGHSEPPLISQSHPSTCYLLSSDL